MSRRALCLLHIYDLYQGGKDHMKKNVKFLGMAAAALLAVAPVATAGVANAATDNGLIVNAGGGVQATTPAGTHAADGSQAYPYSLNISRDVVNVSTSTPVSTYENASQLNLKLSTGSVVATSKVTVSDQPSAGNVPSSFVAGNTYYQQATITVNGLQAGKWYKIGTKVVQASPEGTIANIFVSAPLHAYDEAIQGQPYFKDMTAGGINLANGAFAYKAQSFTAGESVSQIEAAVRAAVVPMVNENGTNSQLNYNFGSIATQLANQGVTLTDNNTKVSANATSFYITVTTVNPKNNKTAVARVQFNKEANQNVYPAIYKANTLVKQGNSGAGIADVSAKKGSDYAKSLAKDPIKALGLKAYSIANNQTGVNNTTGQIDLKVLGNNIDANKVGVYPVTLRATNANGYTTELTFNVIINPVAGDNTRTATVQYKTGYGVNIWNVLSSTNVSFSGKRAMAGSTVTIYGEKTVNGVKYYQIGSKDSNEYIQAQYIDGTSSETTKPSTNKGEESVSGVLTVRYDGKGKVGLTNANGKYTGQYVSKNSRWKVFAKKTINGREFYRIGNQNQWIPADFSELD